jgi:hypothetical protein
MELLYWRHVGSQAKNPSAWKGNDEKENDSEIEEIASYCLFRGHILDALFFGASMNVFLRHYIPVLKQANVKYLDSRPRFHEGMLSRE